MLAVLAALALSQVDPSCHWVYWHEERWKVCVSTPPDDDPGEGAP